MGKLHSKQKLSIYHVTVLGVVEAKKHKITNNSELSIFPNQGSLLSTVSFFFI